MIPIVTPDQMAAIDAAATEPVEVLIDRAGRAVAREALRMLGGGYGRRVVVLEGKGNNGNDGRAATRHLRSRGVRVAEFDAASPPSTLPPTDLVIDAAYGTGFRGTFHAPRLADPDTPVLAVDIPSGVSGLTGTASGDPFHADVTVTFAALKPGLLVGDGPVYAGASWWSTSVSTPAPRPARTWSRPPTWPVGCRGGRSMPTSGTRPCGWWRGHPA